MDQPRNITIRRRVFSLQPNTFPRTAFAKNYVNHLVPALMNIGNEANNPDNHEREKLVRYEVDSALVSSAAAGGGGFAWSRALKVKLQSMSNVNVAQNPSLPPKFSSNPNSKPNRKNPKRPKRLPSRPKLNRGGKESQEEVQFNQQLTNLRTLLPGGNEMSVNELLTEVGSYLMALELQVNVLRCLVDTH